jgi:hypothetical protein
VQSIDGSVLYSFATTSGTVMQVPLALSGGASLMAVTASGGGATSELIFQLGL